MVNDLDAYLTSPDAVRHTNTAEGRLLKVGDLVSGFRVVAFLGRGASSEVWRVRDDALNRDLALKILTSQDNTIQRERFLSEARLLAQFDNPRIVRIHGFGETNGRPYFTMDLLRPIPDVPSKRTIRRILCDVLDGLEFLHGKGIIHRDIKPSNVLLNESGRAVLTDLGIAHVDNDTLSATIQSAAAHNLTLAEGHAAALGTPGFGAPEQFAGEDVSPATDIHAAGALLLSLFKSKPPMSWRGLIRRMTSSPPALRIKSVRKVKAHLRLIGLLNTLSAAAALAIACLATWGVFNVCRPNWIDLPPSCIQRFPDKPEVVVKLPDSGHYFLPQLALSPVLSPEAERIGPEFHEMSDGTVDISYPLEVLEKESSWRRRIVKIVGRGTLKCPVITAAEVHVPSGMTLITSGKYKINNPSIPFEYPPPDSSPSNNIGYATYVIEPSAKLIFTDNSKYPSSLISHCRTSKSTAVPSPAAQSHR